MTPTEFKAIRKARNETLIQFARSLGYEGSDDNVQRLMRRIEAGQRPITPETAIKAIQLKNQTRRE